MLYGPGVLRSDYTLYKAIYETNPQQITLLTPTNKAASLSKAFTADVFTDEINTPLRNSHRR